MRIKYREQYDDEAHQITKDNTKVDASENKTDKRDAVVVQKHHKDDVDLNVILARYGVTDLSQLPRVTDPRYYGDFTNAPTFREILDVTHDATMKFQQLPAKIRKRFNDSPAELALWLNDKDNMEEAVAIGLLHKEVLKKPEASPPAPPDTKVSLST